MPNSTEKLHKVLNEQFTPQREFSDKNIRFGLPGVAVDGPANSSLRVTGIPGKGYYGFRDVFYTRIDLAVLGPVELRKEGTFTIEEIVTALNGQKNAFLTPLDLQAVFIPTPAPGETATITLQAAETSLGWVGSLELVLGYGKPQLAAVVAQTTLDEQHWPGGRWDIPAGWAMTYYFDFTSYRDALKIDPLTGKYTDPSRVEEIMYRLGVPTWQIAGATDYPVAALPEANQAFDRVIVQYMVQSSSLYGPLYFHYNLFDEG